MDIYVAGVVVTALVRRVGCGDDRIVLPYTRGDCGVRFSDAALAAEVAQAAIAAVENAEARGWTL